VFGSLAALAIRHRVAVIWLFAILAGVAIIGVTRLKLDFSSRSFYGGKHGDVAKLESFHNQWGLDDNQFIVVASAGEPLEKNATIFEKSRIGRLRLLARELTNHPDVTRVVGPHTVSTFVGRESRITTAQKLGLLSLDQKHGALIVELGFSSDDLPRVVAVVDQLRDIVARHSSPHLQLEYAGLPAVRAAFFALTLSDQALFVPLMVLLVALGLFVAFRSVLGVVIPGLAAVLPLLFLLGAMGWSNEPLGLLNQAYFTLIPVLSVASAVHLYSRVGEEFRLRADAPSPQALEQAIVEASRRVGAACLVANITTALGFVSLVTASMPILRQFGLFAALGMTFSFFTVVILLPALIAVIDARTTTVRAVVSSSRRRPLEAILGRCASASTGRPGTVIGAALLFTCAATWFSGQVEIDNRVGDLLEPQHPVRRANTLVDTKLGGSLSLEVDLTGDVRSDDGHAQMEAFMDWADSQPEIRIVLGPGRLPLPRTTPAGDRAHITLRTGDIGGQAFIALVSRARHIFEVSAPSLTATFTGTSYLAYRGVNEITQNLRSSLLLVLGVILVSIAIIFRSIRIALLAALPNLLPLLFTLAVLGAADIQLDPLGAVIATMALGVAADDTIHLLVRTREELISGVSLREAIDTAVRTAGASATITSLILAGGLGINMFSSFPPMALLGLLGALVILFALMADLLLLPAMLMLGGRVIEAHFDVKSR